MFRSLYLFIAITFFSCTSVFAAPSAQDFGALPFIGDAALSRDGEQIAVLINKDGEYIIQVLKLSNLQDTSRIIGLGDKVKPEYLKWVNNDRLIFSFWQSEKIGRTPFRSAYLYTLDTKTMQGKILVDPTKGPSSNVKSTKSNFRQFNNVVVNWLPDDPEHILMSYGDNNNARPDIRRVNVENGQDRIINRGFSNVQTWYTDLRDEPRIGQGRNESDGSWVLRIRDADNDKWRFADEYPGLPADIDIHGFTSNPDELIISSYQGKDTIGLYVYDLGQKKVTRKIYHNDKYDATGVVLNSDGDDIIGAQYISETPETVMLGQYDTILSRMRSQYNKSIVRYIDQSGDGEKVLFELSDSTDPGYLMIVEKDGEPKSLGALRPQIKPQDLGLVISVTYTARDDQKIPAFVTLPPIVRDTAQLKNLPFIILPHGGPYARDSKRFDYLAQFFATRGYGVLQMNFRGSDGYGKPFKESGRKNWVIMQEDVEDGTRWLVSKGYADPKRICIVGWSYGGYAALMGAAKNPDLYSCAASMAGLTDIKDFVRDQKRYRFGRFMMENFIGNGFEDKDDVKANSPVKLADQIKIPLLLAHGKRDQVVHFDQFTRMKSALKKGSAKVTYMEFKNGDHYLSRQKERQDFLVGLEKFLIKSNGKSELMR